jgi:hypothetical protein
LVGLFLFLPLLFLPQDSSNGTCLSPAKTRKDPPD